MAPPPPPTGYSRFRFLSSTGKPPGRRRIASRACEHCRRSKKRCFHLEYSSTRPSPGVGTAPGLLNEKEGDKFPQNCRSSTRGHSAEDVVSIESRKTRPAARPAPQSSSDNAETSPANIRFIGDLNPESTLLSATSIRKPHQNGVGVWHSDSAQAEDSGERNMFTPASLFHTISGSHQRLFSPVLHEQTCTVRPFKEDFEALELFYLNNIHPILPCISLPQYGKSQANTPERIIQEQIICILACTNLAVRSNLRLTGSGHQLTPTEFARKIIESMRLSIELALISDRFIVIQALTAMSLIIYGRESIELAPQFFVRAVCQGLTLGLHQPGEERRDEMVSGLFCYLWSIDRLQAAIHGRPVIMHTIDMAKTPLESARGQEPGFRVFVFISVLLDKVIALYRPNASLTEIPDGEFPSYEEVLTECGALELPARLLATLELYYYGVAVLSCRQTSNATLQTRNTRQASAALQILSIMEDMPAEDLVILPFVPHAVSLALSTAYRDWRHCQLPTHRSRARKRLARSYEHLLPLCPMSWSAAFMAGLSGKVLHQTQNDEVDENVNVPGTNLQRPDHGSREHMAAQQSQDLAETWEQRPADFFDMNLDDLDSILEASLDPQSVMAWWP